MPIALQPLYPIFIKWMPFHIPILFLMYAFIVFKLINYFKIIPISFDLQTSKPVCLRIVTLLICYQFIVTCIIYLYKKVIQLKIQVLKNTGKVTVEEYEQHKKINTINQLKKLEKNENFIEWKKEKLQKEENQKMMPKIVYEANESSSSEEEVERLSEHRLATSKKIF